jgi:hypothetical protein
LLTKLFALLLCCALCAVAVADSIVGIVQDISEICRMQQEQAEKEAATTQLNAMLAAVSTHPLSRTD